MILLSDGVFAIALTLLALNIRLPDGAAVTTRALLDLWPSYLAYAVSFLVILSFWSAHHRIFREVTSHDDALIWLNGVFLMCVAFLPFPVSLIGQGIEQQVVVIVYAASMVVTSLVLTGVLRYVIAHPALLATPMSPERRRYIYLRGVTIPAVFLLSIAVSFLSVSAATWMWSLTLIAPQLVRLARMEEW